MKHILYIYIIVLSFCVTSCNSRIAETESTTHTAEIDFIEASIDSLGKCDGWVTKTQQYISDSSFHFYYNISLYPLKDTTMGEWSKEQSVTLMESLCRKAKRSYRSQMKGEDYDSLKYVIDVEDNESYSVEAGLDYDSRASKGHPLHIFYHKKIRNAIGDTIEGVNAVVMQSLMKDFLSARKAVRQDSVRYTWDEGVTDKIPYVHHPIIGMKDSLSGVCITGVCHLIPAKTDDEKHSIMVSIDKHLNTILKERPTCGMVLATDYGTKMQNWLTLTFYIYNKDSKKYDYVLIVSPFADDGVALLELTPGDAPRIPIPHDWERVKEAHNGEPFGKYKR